MKLFILLATSFIGTSMASSIHPDFVSLTDICPEIQIEASYATSNNFTGSIVNGYKARKAYMAKVPAAKLCDIQIKALKQGYSLKIFDGYRPVKAVEFFQSWAKLPETNMSIKERFYPKFTRLELFEAGYIAKQSSHSRGSAVDLTLVDLSTGKDLDMGSEFDYFDDLSNTDSPLVSAEQRANRMMLKKLMEDNGFKNFSQEWWHFSFKPEPFPERSFDFDVE